MNYYGDLCSVFDRPANAVAFIKGNENHKNIHGIVLFYAVRDGVLVRAEITGLPKSENKCESPVLAFHIHDGGSCSGNENDAFANAGTHYNPNNCLHPYHAGDLPPLFSANGVAFFMFLTDRFSISEIIGKTIIVHSSVDDFTTQPSGNAGEKIACAVITPSVR